MYGCSSKSVDGDISNNIKSYRGFYFAADDSSNIMMQKTDSVLLTITNGEIYSMNFFESNASSDVEFCDHTGLMSGFWTNSIIFIPNSIDLINCDSIRIPRGEFRGDYVTHGDTIYIEKTIDALLYRLKLLK